MKLSGIKGNLRLTAGLSRSDDCSQDVVVTHPLMATRIAFARSGFALSFSFFFISARCSLGNRCCPHCGKKVPAGLELAYSDGLECPHCHTRLEVASGGRSLAVWVGLAAGWLVWWLTRDSGGPLGAVLPELYAVLAFGIVSPIVLAFSATLELAPAAPVAEPAAASSHGASHGGGHH